MKTFEMMNKNLHKLSNLRGGKRRSLLKTKGYISNFENSVRKFLAKIILKTRSCSCFQNSEGEYSRFYTEKRLCEITARGFHKKLSAKGAILIEFAVAMPVLIILIMYIHDLALMKRWYDQMEFVGLQMANMIQNVSQKRENKSITMNDIRHIVAAAYLTIYPETTMYSTATNQCKHYFIHFPHPIMYCVKGIAGGKASCMWKVRIHTNTYQTPATMDCIAYTSDNNDDTSSLYYKTNVSPSQIYSSLKINDGEIKIIVEPIIYWRSDRMDNNGKKVNSAREAFGFFLLSPKSARNLGCGYFNSVVVFSPKPGLFSDTPPK